MASGARFQEQEPGTGARGGDPLSAIPPAPACPRRYPQSVSRAMNSTMIARFGAAARATWVAGLTVLVLGAALGATPSARAEEHSPVPAVPAQPPAPPVAEVP